MVTQYYNILVFAKKLRKIFFHDSYFFTITNVYKTDLSRDKPSIDVLHVVRGGTFTFFSLSERKEKESATPNFSKNKLFSAITRIILSG